LYDGLIDVELEDLPEGEKDKDPFRNAWVTNVLNGCQYIGHVEDIEVGRMSGDRLYRIRYMDGDIEHFTRAQIAQARCSPLAKG